VRCFDNCVGVLVICVLEFIVLYCLYCVSVLVRIRILTPFSFVCTSVRTTVTD
jgi:hypothetical protein